MYIITFTDGTTFKGESPNNSKWNTMPNKAIKRLRYKILGHKILFENFEAYNHIVERIANISIPTGEKISRVILMTKYNKVVRKLIFDYINKKVHIEFATWSQEFNGRKVTGWKKGIEYNTNLNPIWKVN